jgi:hypothetical protein
MTLNRAAKMGTPFFFFKIQYNEKTTTIKKKKKKKKRKEQTNTRGAKYKKQQQNVRLHEVGCKEKCTRNNSSYATHNLP